MKFFGFPQLVQLEILTTMRLGELFLLSLASKRTRKTIKYLYPKNDTEIVMKKNNATVLIETGKKTEIVLKLHMDTPNYEERLEMLNSEQCHIVVRLGKSVDVFSDAEDVVLKMHKYLSDLINCKPAEFVKLMEFFGSVYHKNLLCRRNLEKRIRDEDNKTVSERIREGLVDHFRRLYHREPRDETEFEKFLEFIDQAEERCHGYSKRRPAVSLILDDLAEGSRVEKAVFKSTLRPDLVTYFSQLPDIQLCMINDTRSVTKLSSCPSVDHVEGLIRRYARSEISMHLWSYQGQHALLICLIYYVEP